MGPHLDPSRFRVLFATSPDRAGGLETRGVNLMMEAAGRLPDVDFLVPWRPWAEGRQLADECRRRAPSNVHISVELVPDMTRLFHAVDATIAPFLQRASMKLCPTSLVESLACGRPVLVSTHVGISDLVRDEHCGTVFEPTIESLCDAIARIHGRYAALASSALRVAERYFDQAQCFARHEQLYEEVLTHCAEAS